MPSLFTEKDKLRCRVLRLLVNAIVTRQQFLGYNIRPSALFGRDCHQCQQQVSSVLGLDCGSIQMRSAETRTRLVSLVIRRGPTSAI